jgi:hypothetical protein
LLRKELDLIEVRIRPKARPPDQHELGPEGEGRGVLGGERIGAVEEIWLEKQDGTEEEGAVHKVRVRLASFQSGNNLAAGAVGAFAGEEGLSFGDYEAIDLEFRLRAFPEALQTLRALLPGAEEQKNVYGGFGCGGSIDYNPMERAAVWRALMTTLVGLEINHGIGGMEDAYGTGGAAGVGTVVGVGGLCPKNISTASSLRHHPYLKLFMGYAVRPEEEKQSKPSPLIAILHEIWEGVRRLSLPRRATLCKHAACLLSAEELVEGFEERMATDDVAALLNTGEVQVRLQDMKESIEGYLMKDEHRPGDAMGDEGDVKDEGDARLLLARDDPINGCFWMISYDSWVGHFVDRSEALQLQRSQREDVRRVATTWLQLATQAAWTQWIDAIDTEPSILSTLDAGLGEILQGFHQVPFEKDRMKYRIELQNLVAKIRAGVDGRGRGAGVGVEDFELLESARKQHCISLAERERLLHQLPLPVSQDMLTVSENTQTDTRSAHEIYHHAKQEAYHRGRPMRTNDSLSRKAAKKKVAKLVRSQLQQRLGVRLDLQCGEDNLDTDRDYSMLGRPESEHGRTQRASWAQERAYGQSHRADEELSVRLTLLQSMEHQSEHQSEHAHFDDGTAASLLGPAPLELGELAEYNQVSRTSSPTSESGD